MNYCLDVRNAKAAALVANDGEITNLAGRFSVKGYVGGTAEDAFEHRHRRVAFGGQHHPA